MVEKASVSRAAEELFLTQPAVSLQIKTLENFYETRLFDRISKRLELNQQGKIAYRHARKLIRLYDKMNEEMSRQASRKKTRTLHLGAGTVAGTCFLPRILYDFKKRYPNIEIYFEILKNTEIISNLLSKNLDLGITCAVFNKEGLQYERIFSQSLSLIAPNGHPVARRKKISLNQLKGERLILKEGTCEIRIIWQGFLERHKVRLEDFEIVSVSNSISAIKSAVQEGMGLAVLPVCMVKDELESGRLCKIDLDEGDLNLPSYLALRPASLQKTNVYDFCEFMKAFSSSISAF